MRAFALLDRADMIIGNVLRSRADAAARTQVEQWQLDLATVRAQLDGHACVYCGAADQPMRPNEAWGEESNERFECIDANTCEDRVNEWLSAEFDSYLETLDANAQAEEATAETLRAEERHEVEEEEDRPVYLAELSSEERARIGVSDDDIV